MSDFIKRIFASFFFLGILFIPFTKFQTKITNFIFFDLTAFIAQKILGFETIYKISSDSIGLFIMIGLLMMISIIIAFISNKIKRFDVIFVEFSFPVYLSLILLKYGFDKVFKAQFYLPEPNILFTPFGQLDKDILYWSTMGLSHSYSLFLGMIEIIAAILILFKRTRIIGLIIAIGVFVNVLAINFSFDISVKVFSTFLLCLSIYLLSPNLKRLYQIFVQNKPISFDFKTSTKGNRSLQYLAVLVGIGFILFPYFQSYNFNDDEAKRPFLHGVYEINPAIEPNFPLFVNIQRVFIHRDGYLIFQDKNEELIDFKMKLNKNQQTITLIDYDFFEIELSYDFNENTNELLLQYNHDRFNQEQIIAQKVNWKTLPALINQFHWFIESIN